jgi:hypothetical protein
MRSVPVLGRALDNARRALDDVRRAVTDRAELQEGGERGVVRLTHDEAVELLARHTVGRFAYVAREGAPDVVPVNYAWRDGAILIRSGPGPKLQAAQRGERVAFEVDELDVDRRTGSSVVVTGRATVVGAHPDDDPEPWASGPRRHVIRITPSRVDGRRIG